MAFLQKIKRKTGTAYRIRYRLNGKEYPPCYLPLGTSPHEAKAILSEFDHRLALHKAGIRQFQNPLKPNKSVLTIIDFEHWFFENKKTAIGRSTPPSKRTLQDYQRSFRFLLGSVGNIKLLEIHEHYPKIEEALNPYAPATRSILIRSLRQAWNLGVERGLIKENPFKKIRIRHQPKLPAILSLDEKGFKQN